MDTMNDADKNALTEASDIGDVVKYLNQKVGELANANGCAVLIEDDGNYFQIHRREWKMLEEFVPSLSKQAMDTQQTIRTTNPKENETFNESIDDPEKIGPSACVWLPLTLQDGSRALLLVWKAMRHKVEQEQIPLLVGSEVVGVTTRSKRIVELNDFTDDEFSSLQEHMPFFRLACERVKDLLKQQRVMDSLREEEEKKEQRLETVVTTLQQLREYLTSYLDTLGDIYESVVDTKEVDVDVLQGFFERSLDTKESISRSLERFATEGSGVLLEDKFEKIHTEIFFSQLLKSFLADICEQELRFNYFIDPNLSRYIESSKYVIDVFVSSLLRFCLEDTKRHTAFDVFVERHDEETLRLQVKYFKPDMTDELLMLYQNLFYVRKQYTPIKHTRTEELLIYFNRIFLQIGGKVDVGYDEYRKLAFSVYIPASFVGGETVVPHKRYDGITIGMLFDKERDFRAANNIARYFLAMGVAQGHIKAAQSINALDHFNLTHLIVFQSKYDHDLFKEVLPKRQWKVMIVNDGCPQHQNTTMYDFSSVDTAIEQTELYLEHLYIFLQE